MIRLRIVFSLFFVLAAGGECYAAEKVRALISMWTIDESLAPFAVAKYLGYYEREGLGVELIPVGGSNEVAIQVGAGNAQLGEATPAQAVVGMQEASSAPLDVRYFYDAGYCKDQGRQRSAAPSGAAPAQTVRRLCVVTHGTSAGRRQ